MSSSPRPPGPRVGLVTALLPPAVGGTEILIWRLFHGGPEIGIIAGARVDGATADGAYGPLEGPRLDVPYPRLRGYRYGLFPLLGAITTGWIAAMLPRVVRFLRERQVDHVVTVPHGGPFALLGIAAARLLGLRHTLYVLDAWEEAATGPVERQLVLWSLRRAAKMPGARVAAVSPRLAAHYRDTYGFRESIWIPNPAPLSLETPAQASAQAAGGSGAAVFTGGIKPFNDTTIRALARAVRHCEVVRKLVVTGPSHRFSEILKREGELHDRVEFRLADRAEVSSLQREASVLLVATNVVDDSLAGLGYLPGRLPEYVAAGRPILLIGPENSEAARAVRHWGLGLTTTTNDERELARLLDRLATGAATDDAKRAAFREVFSREEARHRLLGEPGRTLTDLAASLTSSFEAAFAP